MPPKSKPATELKALEIATEFMRYCYDVLGAYLDAAAGITHLRDDLVQFQRCAIESLQQSDPSQASEEFLDQQPLRHEFEADHAKPKKLLHQTTQGEFKQRTASEGLDLRLLGYMAVTLLYGSWEDVYRERLAMALGHSVKNDLKSDLFGDLGNLRHAIVHNHGKATQRVAEAKVLKWFQRDQVIFLSSEHVDALFDRIDVFITQLSWINPDTAKTA